MGGRIEDYRVYIDHNLILSPKARIIPALGYVLGSSLILMEWPLGFSLTDQALDGAPAFAVGPLPASERPIRTQLGALNRRATGPLFLHPAPDRPGSLAGSSPEPPRSTSVTHTEVLRGGYGEATGRLRWGYGERSGRSGTLFHPLPRKYPDRYQYAPWRI